MKVRALTWFVLASVAGGVAPGACTRADESHADGTPAAQADTHAFSVHEETVGPLRVGLSSAEVIALLGEPESRGKFVPDGEFGDFVQSWNFADQGLMLTMASPEAEADHQALRGVLALQSFAQSLPRGLKIGSSSGDLEQAYGDHEFAPLRSPTRFCAGSLGKGSTYTLADDKVVSVFVGPEK